MLETDDVHHKEACAIAAHVAAIAIYIREMNVSAAREGEIITNVGHAIMLALKDLPECQ
jgi:hypothetical protein